MGPVTRVDAVVVGAGPNGLAAAVELARNGLKVVVMEAADEIGGGTRTEELTLPGFLHDVCSAIHPSGLASPFFQEIGLTVDWIHPPIPLTHPLDGGRSTALFRSVDQTAGSLKEDGSLYRRIMGPLVERNERLVADYLGPMTITPRHPLSFARLAALGALPASTLIGRFETEEARALLGGLAAHSIASLSSLGTSGVGLLLGSIGHAEGWPLVAGGSQRIADAMAKRFDSYGGTIETGRRVVSIEEVDAPIVLLDVMPDALFRIAASRMSASGRRRALNWRAGPGIFKLDWALDGPIPWADPQSREAGTVHVAGTFEEVMRSEQAMIDGEHAERPFVLVAQQSLFDPTRAPEGKQTAWGYCHVPNGSRIDMTGAIETQIERFAPGFRDLIIERHQMSPAAFQSHNANYVGGDIGGGRFGLKKVLQLGKIHPYSYGNGVFLCSSATPPGAGVHGMCGYYAARAALASIKSS
jgi:phytoene dehydrogenase-like protein